MSKIAVVIGATGLVGSALVDQLANATHIDKVITLTRRPVENVSKKVENYVVSFDQLGDYADYFKADMLFSCLGTTLRQAGSIQAQRKVDVEYQLRAAELAIKQGVQDYFLVSSSGANRKSSNAYLSMKGELEDAIKLLPFLHISVFQPSLLLGSRPEFRFGEKMMSYFLPLITLFPVIRRYRPIKGKEVAAKMALVSQTEGDSLAYYRLNEIFLN